MPNSPKTPWTCVACKRPTLADTDRRTSDAARLLCADHCPPDLVGAQAPEPTCMRTGCTTPWTQAKMTGLYCATHSGKMFATRKTPKPYKPEKQPREGGRDDSLDN